MNNEIKGVTDDAPGSCVRLLSDTDSASNVNHPGLTKGVPNDVSGSCVRLLSDTDSASNGTLPGLAKKQLFRDLTELPELPSSGAPPHPLHRGIDLNLAYDIETDSQFVILPTYTKGCVEVFVLFGSSVFTLLEVKKRFSVPTMGCPTFVRSTCMSEFPRFCRGCIIAFSMKCGRSWTSYKLGVVSTLRYFVNGENKHEIDIYEHIGGTDEDGVPLLLRCKHWDTMLPHLMYRSSISLNDVKFVFLNQVNSAVILYFPTYTGMALTLSSNFRQKHRYEVLPQWVPLYLPSPGTRLMGVCSAVGSEEMSGLCQHQN